MEAKLRKLRKPGRSDGTGISFPNVFTAHDAAVICEGIRWSPRKSHEWIALALNDAVTDYVAEFTLARAATPSALENWTAALRGRVDVCLEMLTDTDGARAPCPISRDAAHALKRTSQPLAGEQLRIMGFHGDPEKALDQVMDGLWILRNFANYASQEWAKRKSQSKARHHVRKDILKWVSNLGCRYVEIFGKLPPTDIRKGGPFLQFHELIRRRILKVRPRVTDNGPDEEAYGQLESFGPTKLASFVRNNSATLSRLWRSVEPYTPYQTKLQKHSDLGE